VETAQEMEAVVLVLELPLDQFLVGLVELVRYWFATSHHRHQHFQLPLDCLLGTSVRNMTQQRVIIFGLTLQAMEETLPLAALGELQAGSQLQMQMVLRKHLQRFKVALQPVSDSRLVFYLRNIRCFTSQGTTAHKNEFSMGGLEQKTGYQGSGEAPQVLHFTTLG
jgi:hypothetical protein